MNILLYYILSAFADFRRNKIRTFLTSLGILIGVLSVVLLIAFGLGLKNYIKQQFENLGTNLVIVFPGKAFSEGGFRPGPGLLGGKRFDENDVKHLSRINEVERVVPVFFKTITVEGYQESKVTEILASTADIFPVLNIEIEKGESFDKSDVDKRAKRVVIGPTLAKDLFDDIENALGKKLSIEKQRFTVIGVSKEKGGGGFGGPNFDSFVYLPFSASYSFNPDKEFVEIYLQARQKQDIDKVKKKAESVLLKRYDKDDFSVVERTEVLKTVSSIFSILNSILVAIGSISLLVGGIGIMNIMYATVTERIKEIGIRRAIGATKRDILLLFLTQAVFLSLIGGILGLIISFIIVSFIQRFFPASISIFSVIAALSVSSVIGIFFGVFPAKKAADLSPIDAIRYE